MKKLFTLFLALVATTALWAYDFQVNSICYNITSDTTVEVTSSVASSGYQTNYPNLTIANIPETVIYNGSNYSVTSIGSDAFYKCSSLTSVIIPNSVTSIEDDAFYGCTSLIKTNYTGDITGWCGIKFENSSSNPISRSHNLYVNNQEVKALTIPNSVDSIYDYAFYNCSSLTSVTIPNSVTNIGRSAFSGCTSLIKTNYTGDIAGWCGIKFGNSNSNPISYSHNLYINDQEVKALAIPNSVDSIYNYAFYKCSSLISVTIPNSVITIGSSAFSGCSSLTSITIPNSVTTIGSEAFYNCSSLTSVTIPNSVTTIGRSAFEDCFFAKSNFINNSSLDAVANNYWGAIVGDIEIDGMLIRNDAVIYCRSYVTSVTIPNNVATIGSSAFSDCSSLTSVTIPNSVTTIGSFAFSGCSSLTSITIPENVVNVGGYVFDECCSLTSVVWNAKNVTNDYGDDGIFGSASDTKTQITSITFGDNVERIPSGLCYRIRSLSSLIIGNNVTTIGSYAFEDCYFAKSNFINNSSLDAVANNYWGAIIGDIEIDGMLIRNDTVIYCRSYVTSVTIPNSVTTIGSSAFFRCSSLTSITIPNNVTTIGSSAFSSCSSLTAITIPNSVTTIGSEAFSGCSSLTKTNYTGDIEGWCGIKFGNSSSSNPISYSHNLYINDQEVKALTIPNSVDSIYNYAFYNCSSLTSVTIPNSVTTIGSYAFSGCSSLTSINIPENVTSIGDNAFRNCSSLIAINIPNSVTSIGEYAFYKCSLLTSVTIPNNVTSIGNYAFGYCSSLTSITSLAETPPTISSNTFNEVNKSIPVDVPCGKVSTYKSAQYWKLFTNIQKLNADYSIIVSTQNSKMGSAKVDYNNACDGNQISATANYGYHFTQWSDGNTDNPRTLVLTQDTVLTAEFALTTNGQCGKNLYWDYNESTQSLSITGSGDMYNNRPWGLFTADMKEAVLPHGITHIGDDAFTDCVNLKEITIPASVTSIGVNSFAGCRYLRNVNCYPLLPPYAESTSFANYNVNLNVPCDYLEDYQYDIVFGSFKYIQCIGADSDNADTVVVTPGSTDVTITWPTKDNAYTYTIVIKKNGETVCTLTFNMYGQLINIKFAPGRNGNHSAQYAEQMNNAYRFTVTGLEEGTQYTYSVETKDETESTIDTQTGEFTTKSNTPTSVVNIQSSIANSRKLLRHGQLIILKDGVEYNAQGVRL